MNKNDFFTQLEDVLEMAPQTLKGEFALKNISGWDSMAVVAVIAIAAEDGVELLPEQFAGLETMDDIFRLASGVK